MKNTQMFRPATAFLLAISCASCAGSDGQGLPGSPTPSTASFLVGTWKGPSTIMANDTPMIGTMTWRIVEDHPVSTHQQLTVTITSTNPWWPTSITTLLVIDTPAPAPGQIGASGSYPSPRGCLGSFVFVGPANPTLIDANVSGVDCQDPVASLMTFSGRVQLTKQ